MQGSESTAYAAGWPKRTKVIVGVGALVFFVAWFTYMTVDFFYPGAFSPPSSERQAYVTTALTSQIREAYGSRLESVDVQYRPSWRAPSYDARFRLKGAPFTFRFSEEDQSIQPYYHDRSFDSLVLPELLGGPQRVVELTQAYHRDFPAALSMGFKRTYAGNLPAPLPQQAQGMRPTVLVADGEPFQSELGSVTAVYAWDAGTHAWKLINRGPLSEPGT